MDIWGVITPRDCDELPINFLGPTPALDGPMEWFLIIGLAGGGLLLVQAADAILTRHATRTFWLLWTVNLALAGLLVWSFALYWAWLNPGAPAARPIFQVATFLQKPHEYSRPPPIESVHNDYGNWTWDAATESWTNTDIGLIQRAEIVRTCLPAERMRAQLKLIYGSHTPEGVPIDDLDKDYLTLPYEGSVLYDLEGNYLVTLGGPYERNSTITRKRDAAYDPSKAAMSPEEAERRFMEDMWSIGAPDTSWPPPRPRHETLSKDEIDQIVAESWGDERPSWHEAE